MRGPFYIYKTVVNREKINGRTEVLYYWNKKAWAKKNESLANMEHHNTNKTHWFHVSISWWRLETVSINVHKTPVECFEYTVAPRRWPPCYHDHFNAVFPMLMHHVLFHYRRPTGCQDRGHSPAFTKLLIEHRVTRPYTLSVSLRWKTGNLLAANCSAASRCPEASWIQVCRRECKRSKCQCEVTNSYCKLF